MVKKKIACTLDFSCQKCSTVTKVQTSTWHPREIHVSDAYAEMHASTMLNVQQVQSSCCGYNITCVSESRHSLFWKVKAQIFRKFSIFLKFDEGFSSETKISHLISTLPYKMNLIKIKGFDVMFYQICLTSVQ